MAYDLSKFSNIIKLLQDTQCTICRIEYDKKWCNEICFFCTHFNPCRDTYDTFVKDLYWNYIKSGEDKKEYYTSYLENLQKWCNKFNIIKTKNEEKEENYILQFEC